MTRAQLALATIPLDGMQVRVAIDETVVADYAEQMRAGAVFPPVIAFIDATSTIHLADGFHRCRAAKRAGRTTIAADVSVGTASDALWKALEANRTHGHQMTRADKSHAVSLALEKFPEKTHRAIAEQIGCSSSLVTKVLGRIVRNTGVQPPTRGRTLLAKTKRDAVREMVRAGKGTIEIREMLHVHSDLIASVRRELGVLTRDSSRPAVSKRNDEVRQRALDGQTSHQIAAAVGLSVEGCRNLLRRLAIAVPGDVATRGMHRHDSNRIMARIVGDAEDLAAGANLIDFTELDLASIPDWITTLKQARTTLGMFIKRLMQEQTHGEAAQQPNAVEDSTGPHRADAGAAGAGDSARVSSGAR